jgi:hypothetical protein
VKAIISTVEASSLTPGEKNSPLHYLRASCADFDNGNPAGGVQDLQQFQLRVTEKVLDPEFAKYLIQEAQKIIDAVKSQSKGSAAAKPRRKR